MPISKLSVPVIIFKEDGQFVAYSPALDLSTCGRTLAQTQKNFADAVRLFFEELEDMGTLDKALRELGWVKKESQAQPWALPRTRDMRKYSSIPLHILKTTQIPVQLPVC